MNNFFSRIDSLSLVPGNKSSGFVGVVSTPFLIKLAAISPTVKELAYLQSMIARQLTGAFWVRKIDSPTILLQDSSAIPRYFGLHSGMGASIGADAEMFGRLHKPDALDWLGLEVSFTPHNCDAPQQALTLLLLFQAWTEWAQMLLDARRLQAQRPAHVQP